MASPILETSPKLAAWGGGARAELGVFQGEWRAAVSGLAYHAAALSYARRYRGDLRPDVLLWFVTRRDEMLPKVHAYVLPRLAVWLDRTKPIASDGALVLAFLDATEYVLNRRAGVCAQERAWQLVMRKQTYLDVRGFITRTLWRAIDGAYSAYETQLGTKRTCKSVK